MIQSRVRLNYATTHHHPLPATTIHHHPPPAKIHPPPPTTSQNISTTTYHHPPKAKIYPPPPSTSQDISTTTHQQPKPFFKKPVYKNLQPLFDGNVRNLNGRPAIAKKLFYTWLSTLFLLHTPEIVLKSSSVNNPFILCETSLVLKKGKFLRLVSAIFIKFLFFHQMIALQKL